MTAVISQPRLHTAPPGLGVSGTKCIIFDATQRGVKPLMSFETTASAAALKAQLAAKERVRAYRAGARASFSTPRYAPAAFSSSSCSLSPAEVYALMSREISPEDYELLLRLDEGVEKKDRMSESDAAALLESTLEGEAQCSVCLCDIESGESTVLLACGHHFHPACIKSWLVKGKDTCPLCNAKAMQ